MSQSSHSHPFSFSLRIAGTHLCQQSLCLVAYNFFSCLVIFLNIAICLVSSRDSFLITWLPSAWVFVNKSMGWSIPKKSMIVWFKLITIPGWPLFITDSVGSILWERGIFHSSLNWMFTVILTFFQYLQNVGWNVWNYWPLQKHAQFWLCESYILANWYTYNPSHGDELYQTSLGLDQ